MQNNIKRITLSNGIPVLYEHRPQVRSVSFRAHLSVGTRHEQLSEHGMAHFLEHMMFKGTKQRSAYEIANSIERFGGMLNAYTSKEETVYYANVVDEYLYTTVDTFSDMLYDSKLDRLDIEHEKSVVHEEIKGALDTPDDIIWDLFIEELLAPNSVGRRTLGTKESVSSFKEETLKQFWKSKYSADNLYLGIVGNIEEEKLLDKLETSFGRFERHGALESEFKSSSKLFHENYHRGIEQSHVLMGKEICDYHSSDRFALVLLNNILGAGMSSRMFQNIREKYGFAYSVYSTVDFNSDHGLFVTYVATDPKHVDECKNLVKKEISSFLDGNISDKELDDAKHQIKGAMLLSLESNHGRLERMLRHFIRYESDFNVEKSLNNFLRLSKENLVSVAQKYLNPDKMASAVIGPR